MAEPISGAGAEPPGGATKQLASAVLQLARATARGAGVNIVAAGIAPFVAACSDPGAPLAPRAGARAQERGAHSSVARDEAPSRDSTVVGEYLVRFRDDVQDVPGLARQLAEGGGGSVRFAYTTVLRGFAARLPAKAAAALSHSPHVVAIEPNRAAHSDATQSAPPSWGLDRIDQAALPLGGTYTYANDGRGVGVYVFDTGVRTTHADFGGRASGAWTAINDGGGTGDCKGHGTHVAGTAGGASYGVAKGVALYSVRVLDCTGYGDYSGMVAGLDWVAKNRVGPAVVNMSLGGPTSSYLNAAVAGAVASGVVVVASAGNSATDACNQSPASEPSAITVAATRSDDSQAAYSNYGSCVDLYAPGSGIVSAYNSGDAATMTMNGTSMAAPHVAGAAALYLAANPAATPREVAAELQRRAALGVVKNAGAGSPNALLNVAWVGTPLPAPVDTAGAQPAPAPDAPPSASFSVSCQAARARCSFDGSASADDRRIVSWTWTFGDGSAPVVTSAPTAGYTFPRTGPFTVTLKVTDSAGQTATTSRVATVKRL